MTTTLTAPRAQPPAAPAGRPPMTSSWLAAQGRLPLAFMILGLAWLAVAAGWLALAPAVLTYPHAAPAVVALTHAWVLGFFVTIATGASYQIAPVALGTTLASDRLGWWHFGLHALAVPGMIVGFVRWELRLVMLCGGVLLVGLVLFALNTGWTVVRSRQRDAVAWSLVLASGWLVTTATAGLLLAANRIWNFWPVDPLALLRAHAHLGLIGLFLTLLQGVSFRLVPMFTLAVVPDWRPVRLGLWLSQLGLLGLAPCLALGAGTAATGFGLMILAGAGCSGWALKQTLATRKKRRLDPGLVTFAAGVASLIVAAVMGMLLVSPRTRWGSAPGGFNAMIYGVALFAGALLPVFAGMLGKIIPFLVWMRAYGPRVGRGPTPVATDLTHPARQRTAFALMLAAVLPLLAGIWMLNTTLVAVAAAVLAAGVALFIADMIGVLRHLSLRATFGASIQ